MSEKVTCPFNSVHVVERHRLVVHMSRCIKSYRGGTHTPMHCPLDYSHVVEAGKMNEHLVKCPQLALAAPLLSVDLGSDVVTGNLQLPEQPSSINQLVTAEWDSPQHQQPAAAAAANASSFADDASTVGGYADAFDGAGSVYGGGVGGGSEAATSSAFFPAGGGLGRGRGRARPLHPGAEGVGLGVGLDADGGGRSGAAEFAPGDLVPGGYTLKHVYYPSGFEPRGRFEVRGSI